MSVPDDLKTETVVDNLFALPWLNLEEFYVHYSQIDHANMEKHLHSSLKDNKLPHLRSLGIQQNYVTKPIVAIDLFYDVVNCVKIFRKCYLRDFFVEGLSHLEIRSCRIVPGYLSTLRNCVLLSFQTLILSDCGLNSDDLNSLAQASVDGRLPELKYLDLSHNKLTGAKRLFWSSSSMNQLLTLDIRNNYLDIIDITSFMTQVKRDGLLGILQELGIDHYPNMNTQWPHLKALYCWLVRVSLLITLMGP